ncbi:MAG TPA: uroporphyrinogen-III C-methyltransferase [Dehalococcoidia bacterium]|nr:uroporphyrinogen-III C-methyltransferase [Dehalococcoidia bacterium]
MAEGRVVLVGAGPGDPGLITVAGRDYLAAADVVVYDRLVNPQLLKEARHDAELIFAGKEGGGRHTDQETINRLLIEKAREGKLVVRLKGGDPFVFGRGGEEAGALRAAGVPYLVVPGITSAIAGPAYGGIPVTDRRLASSFVVVTGHEDDDKAESSLDWRNLATVADTIVVLMGGRALPEIVEKLIAGGRPAETPAAVIESATTPRQRTVTGTLGDIAERVAEAGLATPALAIIGDVVSLRQRLAWFEQGPLFGRTVLVTRSRSRAGTLSRLLAQEGAIPIELPAIDIEPAYDAASVEKAIAALQAVAYAWVVFTSANAVEIFFRLLAERGLDPRALAGTRVAAIGPATAAELRRQGLVADVVPDEFIAEAVLEALKGRVSTGQRLLLPRAEGARAELPRGLQELGVEVDELVLYRAAIPQESAAEAVELLRDGQVDIVTFTSSSTVRNLLRLLGDNASLLKRPFIACIGPVTAEAARRAHLRVDVTADEYTVPGLVLALREAFAERMKE